MLKEEPPLIRRDDYMIKNGIDVSHHQGNIDFAAVKNSGIDFVIIREGYGTNTDRCFFDNVKKAKAVGLEIFGVYHFCYSLMAKEAKEEAIHCVNNVFDAGLDQNVICFFDFEYDTISKAGGKGVKLGPNECCEFTEAFCEEIKILGYTPGVYANIDFVNNYYNWDLLHRYELWLADYSENPMYGCLLHQYSNKGKIAGIRGNVDLNHLIEKHIEPHVVRSREVVVDVARSWVGKNEKDGSYKEIVDIYNRYQGDLPRGIKMDYSWPWCACTWSALAIGLEYTDVMPIEISCGYLIEEAKKMGCWTENDAYIPAPGDGILYDWDDNGIGDNTGWPDHVGTVEYVNEESGYMTVIEGNYSDAVKRRTISLNGKYIRGFITPKYSQDSKPVDKVSGSEDYQTVAREVIAGMWGNGDARKSALASAGYDPEDVQKIVNSILNTSTKYPAAVTSVESTCYAQCFDRLIAGSYMTTADLHCRNDAGTNKKSLCVFPKNTIVDCYGYFSKHNGDLWYYVVGKVNGVKYTGFCSSKYLKSKY